MKGKVKVRYLEDFGGKKKREESMMSEKDAAAIVKEGICEYVKKVKKESIAPNKIPPSKKPTKKENNTPSQTDESKKILKQEMQEQKFEDMKANEINWLEGDFWDSWDKIKGHMKNLWRHKKEYLEEPPKWFFLGHDQDKLRGKPQLIETVQKKIPLVRMAVKKHSEGKGEEKIETDIQSFYFFDERFDKRYDGFLRDTFSLYFYFYQIVTKDAKRYFILTQEKLPNEICDFSGMLIELQDFTEMSRNLKLPSLSGFFILKEAIPSVKILSPEELIKFSKEKEITELQWLNLLAYHPLKSINNFPIEFEQLRSAYILSGKLDGWPMHLGIVGPPGTNKTMGNIETISYKFDEEPRIAEGTGWTIKGLGPSFKQSIADLGYLAKAHRMGFIDEIGKMVEKEMNSHQAMCNNLLGDFNFLLEHKNRLVGSGNTGEADAQATAKFMFATNPVSSRRTIGSHIGAIDPTFMSRIFWWVQNEDEQNAILGPDGVIRSPPRLTQDSKPSENPHVTYTSISLIENRKKGIVLGKLWGGIYDRDSFLTFFDSCYNFVCEIDDLQVNRLCDIVTNLSHEPMKSSVWKPRAYHHVKLLIDGLCKHRCLFRDYDAAFTAKQEDYELAERILIRMVNGWETNLQPKEEI